MIVRDEGDGRMPAAHTIIRVCRTSHCALKGAAGAGCAYTSRTAGTAQFFGFGLQASGRADCGAGTETAG